MKILNLKGQKFGKLTVIKLAEIRNATKYWLCRCECGNNKTVEGRNLNKGNTKSCGCLKKDKSLKHGMINTVFYHIYVGIKQRCLNKNNVNYKNYGSRGIKVCKRWNKFENFKEDMYESYLEHIKNNTYTSIDRINNNGNYCKKNCKWSTKSEQANNTRRNHNITYQEKTKTLSEWSRELNINKNTLRRRLKNGWETKKAFETCLH